MRGTISVVLGGMLMGWCAGGLLDGDRLWAALCGLLGIAFTIAGFRTQK
jgi:hypothetical protein